MSDPQLLQPERPECDCVGCLEPSSFMRKDVLGKIHRACTKHSKLLEVWVQSVASEVYSEGRAAEDFEERAYGNDEDY